jgi:hypothetical protein
MPLAADSTEAAALKIGAENVDVPGEGAGRMDRAVRARALHVAAEVARRGRGRVRDMTEALAGRTGDGVTSRRKKTFGAICGMCCVTLLISCAVPTHKPGGPPTPTPQHKGRDGMLHRRPSTGPTRGGTAWRGTAPGMGPYQVGLASYYGRRFHGRRTANGERFDMYGLTAAHRVLPLGSVIRVTNVSNGRSVRVRINDRGPYIRGRVIDLSYAAAYRLGMVRSGLARVTIELVEGE